MIEFKKGDALYANDILNIVRVIYLGVLRELLKGLLEFVDSWCRTTGLSVSLVNVEIIVFDRKKSTILVSA